MKKLLAIATVALGVLFVGASSPNCQQGYFCVVDYPTPQDAITAAVAAGGGTVLFTQNTLTAVPITVPDKIRIECSSPGIAIGTTSATADLFTASGTDVSARDCTMNYAGPIPKTAGYLWNGTGVLQALDGIIFGGNCFVCLYSGGIEMRFSNSVFSGNFAGAPTTNSGAMLIASEVFHISNVTLGATPVGNFYQYGAKALKGAIDSSNVELITTKYGVWLAPTSGTAVFWKGTTTYADNCLISCGMFQTQGGAIGYSTFLGMEFGALSGGTPITIDTSLGGNIGMIRVGFSEVFNYSSSPSTNSVNLSGSLGVIDFSHNSIGDNANGGFVINAGANCTCIVSNNVLHGTGAGFWGGAVVNSLRVHDNVMNGSGINQGGNPASSFYNNL